MKSLKKKLECKALTVYACYGKQQPDRLLCYVGKQAIICQNYKQKWTIFLHNWFLSKNRLQRICLLFSKQSILDDQRPEPKLLSNLTIISLFLLENQFTVLSFQLCFKLICFCGSLKKVFMILSVVGWWWGVQATSSAIRNNLVTFSHVNFCLKGNLCCPLFSHVCARK